MEGWTDGWREGWMMDGWMAGWLDHGDHLDGSILALCQGRARHRCSSICYLDLLSGLDPELPFLSSSPFAQTLDSSSLVFFFFFFFMTNFFF